MEVKAKIINEELKDGLENLVANMGTELDKRAHSRFKNTNPISVGASAEQELSAMYRTDWMAGKLVDILPDDMTREWRQFVGDIDPDEKKIIEEEEDRIGLQNRFNEAHKWARLYGTAFIIIAVDDGQSPDKPLIIDSIKEGGLKHIKVVDRYQINPSDVVPTANPMDPNFGLPEFYKLNDSNVKIHNSRMLRFDGNKLPYNEFRRNNYCSDSILNRLYQAMIDFNTATSGSASMIYETNVDIMKVKGLMNYLQTPEGEALVRKRFTLAGLMKSFNNTLLLDAEESFETKTNSFSGLHDLLDRFALFLSAGSDIPATRFLGSSARGLNATGEGDLKNYYDTAKSLQVRDYKPKLDYFDRIMSKSLGLSSETELIYEFNSLFQMTPKEQADTELARAQRDAIYLSNGVITEGMVASELQMSKTYSVSDEFIEELNDIDNWRSND